MNRYGLRITAEKKYFENPAIGGLCSEGHPLEESLKRYFDEEVGSERVLLKYSETGEIGILEIMALDEEAASSVIKFYELYLPEACIGVGKNKILISSE